VPGIDWNTLLETAGSGSFEPLPPSEYEVEVEKAEAKKASQSGKTMFVVTFKVTTGPYANRKLWNNYVVSPESEGAMGFFFRHMKAFGLNAEFFKGNPHEDTVAAALVGKKVKLEVGQRTWQGEIKNDVKNTKPSTAVATGSAAPPPPPPAPIPPVREDTKPTEPATPPPNIPTRTQESETVSAGPPKMPF
jgi:hypothetical protein